MRVEGGTVGARVQIPAYAGMTWVCCGDGVGASVGMTWGRCGMVGGGGRNVEASSYLPVGSRPFLEIPDSVLYGSQFGVLFVYEMITPL